MSIQLLNKNSVIKGILISSVLATQLNAVTLGISNPLANTISQVNNAANNAQNELNSVTGAISSALGSLGIKLNLSCLLPHPHFSLGSLGGHYSIHVYNLCNLKNNFNFKIGPCAGSVNLSSNPLYSRLSNMCQHGDISSTISVGLSGITVSAGLNSDTDFNNIRYASGVTYSALYGNKEGTTPSLFVSTVTAHPNSRIAKDFLTNNKESLLTETFLIKKTGSASVSKAKLPKNIALFNKQVNNNAKIFKQSIPNEIDIVSKIQTVMKNVLSKPSLYNNDHTINYTTYFHNFTDFTAGNLVTNTSNPNTDKTIPKLYKTVHSAINYEYSLKLMELKAKSEYFEYAPTQPAIILLPYQKRRKFLYNSLIWTTQKTLLEGQKQKALAKADESIRITLRKAYIASKPFDSVLAQKELNNLLQ